MPKNLKAFSLSETLIAISLIGILAVTMISMNNFAGYRQKVAMENLAQVDSAIQSWGKAISKANESGMGAAATINSENALVESLTNYFDNLKTTSNVNVKTSGLSGELSGGDKLTLANGVELEVKYIGNAEGGSELGGKSSNNLAVIKATSCDKSASVDQEYVVTPEGVTDTDSMYEGWAKYPVYPMVDENGKETGEKGYCDSGNCENKVCTPATCTLTTTEGSYVYVNTTASSPCPSGQNGTITTNQIGTITGTFEITTDTCCPNPKKFVKFENGNKVCGCPSEDEIASIAFKKGWGYDPTKAECQKPCEKGQYSNGQRCVLCDTNRQCPSTEMTASLDCQAGYACPNDTNVKNDNKYHEDKFDENGNVVGNSYIEGHLNPSKLTEIGYCSVDKSYWANDISYWRGNYEGTFELSSGNAEKGCTK